MRLQDFDPVDGAHDIVWVTFIPFDTSFQLTFDPETSSHPVSRPSSGRPTLTAARAAVHSLRSLTSVEADEVNRPWAVLDDLRR